MKRYLKLVGLITCLALTLCTPAAADNINQIIGDKNTVVFIDVPQTYWAANEIQYFASQGIINGKPDGSFAPTEGVTREAFAKMMALTFHASLSRPATPTFTDVNAEKWSYPYVELCKDFMTGYVSPFDGSITFHPEEYATREDIAVALVRMMGLTDKDAKNENYARHQFSDSASISPNLLPYVSLAAERGLITGFPDGTFGPTKQISRAETVVLLNRASKQAVTTATAELDVASWVTYSPDGKTAYIYVEAPKGTTVTVDNVKLTMEHDSSHHSYLGVAEYIFEEEGTKTFSVTATQMGKTKTFTVTGKYEVGTPRISITQCPTSVTSKTVTISGEVSDDNYTVSLTINGKSVRLDYYHRFSQTYTLSEGENIFEFVATSEAGKMVKETRTINFSAGGPELTITQCPTSVTSKTVTISGEVSDDNYTVSLTINGKSVRLDYYNSFSQTYTLSEGENIFEFVVTSEAGKTVKETRTINFSVGGPNLTITQCPTTVTSMTVTISGEVSDDNYTVSLTINGKSVSLDYYNRFSQTYTLSEGENTFEFVATSEAGKTTTESRTITMIVSTPEIHFYNCPESTQSDSITIEGAVSDNYNSVRLYLNDQSISLRGNGDFSKDVTLQEGKNMFTFRAVNSMGKETTVVKTVYYETQSAVDEPVEDPNE